MTLRLWPLSGRHAATAAAQFCYRYLRWMSYS